MEQNTIGTKYKRNKIQIEQNAKLPKYKHNKIQKDKKQRGQNAKRQNTKNKIQIQIRNTFTEYGLRFAL